MSSEQEVFVFLAYDTTTKTWYFLHEVQHQQKYDAFRDAIDTHLYDALDEFHMSNEKDKIVIYSIYSNELIQRKDKIKTRTSVISKKKVEKTFFTSEYLSDAYKQAIETYKKKVTEEPLSDIACIVFHYDSKPLQGEYFLKQFKQPINFKKTPDNINGQNAINYETIEVTETTSVKST